MRASRDCIKGLEKRILDNDIATPEELKALEKKARALVTAANKTAKASPQPDPKELYTDIYWQETPKFIRGADIESSVVN